MTARRRLLARLEFGTGAAAVTGGLLLAARPDGAWLGMTEDLAAGTPFPDWRIPGLALAGAVGAGGVLAGVATATGHRAARRASVAYGAGLVAFEAVELAWIPFSPLQVVFAVVGAAIVGLALDLPAGAGTTSGHP